MLAAAPDPSASAGPASLLLRSPEPTAVAPYSRGPVSSSAAAKAAATSPSSKPARARARTPGGGEEAAPLLLLSEEKADVEESKGLKPHSRLSSRTSWRLEKCSSRYSFWTLQLSSDALDTNSSLRLPCFRPDVKRKKTAKLPQPCDFCETLRREGPN